ncbi:FMN-binding glutamate synthase family protein [Mechercharimyces sp. CAU 1602]|uniref:FMN-binding glutamate synthase family protein n=1 Tax=Mechercharimyces sp. CAU 1602 TaxID=2973933 RepID=UPI002162791E|nr:FMN-binding glutamate synthase family protein [Mechercharimyces sp. CAU 1602]MCS1350710.1 FMN-binding glutamate synthase family protein [Mechercharimyces sp. CAU 1602]
MVTPLLFILYLHGIDRKQDQHSVLRNFPVLGRMRFIIEKMGPELRQYLFDHDTEGKPYSRVDFLSIVKRAKYFQTKIGFGSQRDFDAPGFFIRNALFPKQMGEMRMKSDAKIKTKKYELDHDGLFSRKEHLIEDEVDSFLLADEDAIVIGPRCEQPFRINSLVGMSGMSFGSLGDRAITALSEGLGMARGTWMNTGEGGISPYHLKGNVDIILQIGPGLFGVRNADGSFDWEALREKAALPQVKAIELKLGQGAKIRGGHVGGSKVTPEIAEIRRVEPYQTIDSPNRFNEFSDVPTMVKWIERMRQESGIPIGIKIVMGGKETLVDLAKHMKETGQGPDFITIDGGEGGTGATYQELADGVGLPLKPALMCADETLRQYHVREQVVLIASGKLFTPDGIAIALSMGADLVNMARSLMITVGCIQALKCHTNECPVGVATTDPYLQKALVVEEKKYRVLNYMISLRQGLYRIAAAAGIDSPTSFERHHVSYQHDSGEIYSLEEWMKLKRIPTSSRQENPFSEVG